MIEPKEFEIEGLRFYTQPLPAFTAVKLDKKVIQLALPVLNGLSDFSMESEVDIEAITAGVSESLTKLTDEDFENFILKLLSATTYQGTADAPANSEITKSSVNEIFQGRILGLYKVLLEVMRFNRFSPFELMGDGSAIKTILSSSNQKKTTPKRGSALEKSGGLLGN